MKNALLTATLAVVSSLATGAALAYALNDHAGIAALLGIGGYVCTFALGLVMGAE